MPRTWTATRHRSFTTLKDGTETYCLIFTYTLGDPLISVQFRDMHEHDVINVFDYETGEPRVKDWDDFRSAVNEYMAGQTRDSLRLWWMSAA